MHRNNNDLVEIDIKELFHYLLGKIWIIFVIAVCCAASFGIYAKKYQRFMYSASASIYIVTQENGKASYADLQLGTQLIKDYMALATSETVINEVIDETKLNISYGQVRSSIFMNNPEDTRVIYFSVNSADSDVALMLVNSLVKVVSKRASEIMNIPKSNVIDSGKIVAVYPTINVKKNSVIGGVLGLALSCITFLVKFVQNDTIRSEVDLKKYFGLDLLAIIPISYERSKFRLNADNRKEAKEERKYRKKVLKQERKKNIHQEKMGNQIKQKKKVINQQENNIRQSIVEAGELNTLDKTEFFEQDWGAIDELKNLDIYFVK